MNKPAQRPKRAKFVTVSIELRTEQQRDIAHAKLNNVPLDADRPIEVVFREKPVERGLDQNGLYWKRLGEIAEQAWVEKRQYNADSWHEYAKLHIMPDIITTRDGVERSKWTELPGGGTRVISTTELERGCFANYTHLVEVFGASLGTHFSANPREGRG